MAKDVDNTFGLPYCPQCKCVIYHIVLIDGIPKSICLGCNAEVFPKGS